MSTGTTFLNMSKPADGDTSWGTELRQALDTLDFLHAPDFSWFVSPAFADGDLYPTSFGTPSDNRYHATIQAAINEIEAGANNVRNTIFVAPGTYNENLTITKSVHIVAMADGYSQFGLPTRIAGTGSDSTITVNPVANETVNVTFANFWISQAIVSQGGTTVTWPHWLEVTDQGSGLYPTFPNNVSFDNCYFRMETPIGADVWTYGMRVQGFSRLNICSETQMIMGAPSDLTKPISIEGNIGTGKIAELQMKHSEIQWYQATSENLLHFDGGSDGVVYDCGFTESDLTAIRTFGGSGTNQCSGLTSDAQADKYKIARGAACVLF